MKLLLADLHQTLMRQPGNFTRLPFEPSQQSFETIDCKAAHFEPEQLERVVACHRGATLEGEIKKLQATSWTERATKIANLEDALVIGGQILSASGRHFMSTLKPYRSVFNTLESHAHAAIPNSVPGLKYFGHWLRDDCSAHEMLRGTDRKILSLKRPGWPDCAVYEALLCQDWTEKESFHAGSLQVISDTEFNLCKKRRLETLRRRMKPLNSGRGVVYIRRGPAGRARDIVNERDLMDGLAARSVTLVDPEQGDERIVRECLGADLIITVEGSQAAHALYLLKDGGSLLILQPPNRFYNPHVEWTRMMGMQYGIVVGEVAEGGMKVHLSEVMSMTDRLLNRP